jgi:hypothetical protein
MLGDDLDLFFNPNEFAQLAVAVLQAGQQSIRREMWVIFDEYFDPTYMRPMFDYTYERAGAKAESRSISVLCKSQDAEGMHHRDRVEVNGRSYEVMGISPVQDGRVTLLQLKE